MKFIVTGTATYYAYSIYKTNKQKFWFWGSVFIAVLFNPIIPVYLGDKSVWGVVDIIAIGFLACLPMAIKKYFKQNI